MEKNYIGVLVKNGNKIRARKIFYTAMIEISRRLNQPYYRILSDVHTLCAPIINLRYIRKSGQSYSIPSNLTYKKSVSLTVRWVVASALARKTGSITEKLIEEIVDVLNSKGTVYTKRVEFHRKAVANRFLLRISYKKKLNQNLAGSELSNKYFQKRIMNKKKK